MNTKILIAMACVALNISMVTAHEKYESKREDSRSLMKNYKAKLKADWKNKKAATLAARPTRKQSVQSSFPVDTTSSVSGYSDVSVASKASVASSSSTCSAKSTTSMQSVELEVDLKAAAEYSRIVDVPCSTYDYVKRNHEAVTFIRKNPACITKDNVNSKCVAFETTPLLTFVEYAFLIDDRGKERDARQLADLAIVKRMVDLKANVNEQDSKRRTALFLCFLPKVTHFLLNVPNIDLTITDIDGKNAYDYHLCMTKVSPIDGDGELAYLKEAFEKADIKSDR